jgi:hypothetical protein
VSWLAKIWVLLQVEPAMIEILERKPLIMTLPKKATESKEGIEVPSVNSSPSVAKTPFFGELSNERNEREN